MLGVGKYTEDESHKHRFDSKGTVCSTGDMKSTGYILLASAAVSHESVLKEMELQRPYQPHGFHSSNYAYYLQQF